MAASFPGLLAAFAVVNVGRIFCTGLLAAFAVVNVGRIFFNRYLPEFMQDYNRRFARAARNDHDAHRPLLERDCLDDIFTWQEERRVTV